LRALLSTQADSEFPTIRFTNFRGGVFDFLVSTSWKIDAVILPFLTLYHNGFSCCPLVRISISLTTDEGHKSSMEILNPLASIIKLFSGDENTNQSPKKDTRLTKN
jgi:hypothetical protein